MIIRLIADFLEQEANRTMQVKIHPKHFVIGGLGFLLGSTDLNAAFRRRVVGRKQPTSASLEVSGRFLIHRPQHPLTVQPAHGVTLTSQVTATPKLTWCVPRKGGNGRNNRQARTLRQKKP